MTEEASKGNLISKVEVFLNTCIFRGWKDAIISLQSTETLLPWAENLGLARKCIDAIACKALVDPEKVDWTFTYTRAASRIQSESNNEKLSSKETHGSHQSVPLDWWVEDIADLEIDLYCRVINAMKLKDRLNHILVGEALHYYAVKWLPGVSKEQYLADPRKCSSDQASWTDYVEMAARHRQLLEKLVCLLLHVKGSMSCSFLLKLLKGAMILGASDSTTRELTKQVGLQLDEASVGDLLIPSLSYASDTVYDVDLVQTIVKHFVMKDRNHRSSPTILSQNLETQTVPGEESNSVQNTLPSGKDSSLLRVAKLVDDYLSEIAKDDHLDVSRFMNLAGLIPDGARPVHDGLYRAIDIYLKEHPGMTKTERKRLCRLLNCKKLSTEACIHAAQNERLPLRVVVQVLFFEQVRASMAGDMLMDEVPSSARAMRASQGGSKFFSSNDRWTNLQQNFNSIKGDLSSMNLKISEVQGNNDKVKSSKNPFRRLLCKLWPGKKLLGSLKCVES
ncbi:hypothetical protein KP509_03G102000 [Ceratopteris richardii]|nr:hypothetical protein KP509_03G102000 [Ceratopteris richardii]